MASLQFLIPLAIMLMISSGLTADGQGLKVGFYTKTCPKAEEIILKEMTYVISEAPSLSGPLLRLHFHDCFVRGCDGSVLLDSTSNNTAEKAGPPNVSLRGFEVIDKIKTMLESACPGIVSCADIIAVVARDVVALTNGPSWNVPTGRRDGRISRAQDTTTLPPPSSNITGLTAAFSNMGLSTKDLVVLSGAHTLGISHCTSFSNRLYNFTGKGDTDPSLAPNYIVQLKKKCKPNDATTLVQMDPGSSKSFDMGYYKLVSKRRGLFESDAALLQNSFTKAYVKQALFGSTTSGFFMDFGDSMVKMGNIGVLTGTQGEIRKKCSVVN